MEEAHKHVRVHADWRFALVGMPPSCPRGGNQNAKTQAIRINIKEARTNLPVPWHAFQRRPAADHYGRALWGRHQLAAEQHPKHPPDP